MQRKEFLHVSAILGVGIIFHPLWSRAQSFTPSSNVTFYTAKDSSYSSLRLGFNLRIKKNPKYIAICKNVQGVQESILLAIQLKLPVSIKSGGHCMEGFSCGEGSMQIVLSSMNAIQWIDPYRIKVQPACLLASIYAELIPRKRILPGGSCATVAIGGLTLGGGYGLMSRLFGLTCDSLEAVTMIDGNGKLIQSKHDADLLWACKGGGNGNFGVITDLTFKVHNRPSVMSSYRFRSYKITTDLGKKVLKTWFEESRKLPNACFSTCLFNGDTVYILLTNVSKITPAVQQFINKMKSVTSKFTSNLNQPLEAALKNYYGQQNPTRFKNASAGLYKSFADIEPVLEKILQIVFSTKGMIYQLNTLGGAIQSSNFEVGSSFPHRAYPYFSELQTYWDQEQHDEKILQRFEEVQQLISSQQINAQYRNYPDINFKNFEQDYYGDNLVKLKQLKLRYDPNNLIRHEQSIRL